MFSFFCFLHDVSLNARSTKELQLYIETVWWAVQLTQENYKDIFKDIVGAHLLACLQFQRANFDGP